MRFAVFFPFALVHFITFAILIYKSSACQIFDFTVFPKKPTSCQFFTFPSHIHSFKIMQQPIYISLMMLFTKKTYQAVLLRSIFFTVLILTAVYNLISSWSIENFNHSIPLNYNVQSAVRCRGLS